MMTFNSAFRRLAFGLLVSTSGLGLAQVATASVDIETPPLRAVNDAHVCRVTNLNSSTVSVGDLVMLEGVNQVECQSPQPLNLAPGQTAELSCPVAGDFPGVVAYCLVNVPSATIANNMAVSLQLEDANGTALAAVQGLTTTSNLVGGAIRLPSITAEQTAHVYECLVANFVVSQTVSIISRSDSGTISGSLTVNLGPFDVATLQVTPTALSEGNRCEVSGDTNVHTKDLRVSFTVLPTVAGSLGSASPVQGF